MPVKSVKHLLMMHAQESSEGPTFCTSLNLWNVREDETLESF